MNNLVLEGTSVIELNRINHQFAFGKKGKERV
jgi:hypothetical protein